MNAVFAAVLLAVVATVSGTSVVSNLGYQYVQPQYQYQYVQQPQYQYVQQQSNLGYVASQPLVSGSSVVSQSALPLTYASSVYPTTSVLGGYPYAYNYGYSGLGLLKK